ncbi:hypothetical protein SY27_07180 [Flavobacterium sp. 316]|nr:hypothetical protein SY27_07180 [Flavobacterium sp. 316]
MSTKNMSTQKFKGYNNLNRNNYNYTFVIPNGYEINVIEGGSEWKEKQFKYTDSSILYINNEKGVPTINYENIMSDTLSIKESFLSNASQDILTISGIDSQGKYWKNIKYKEINIGYLNVTEDKLKEFDEILSSLK